MAELAATVATWSHASHSHIVPHPDSPMARSTSEDILLLIFDALIETWSTPEAQWPNETYSADCAAVPFHLAAVCRQWRTLMLATSTLWTYFGFPKDPWEYIRHHGRLSLLLERSRNSPVVVILSIPIEHYSHGDTDMQLAIGVNHVLRAINDIAPRWRAAFLNLHTVLMHHFRPALRVGCPILESLAVISGYSDLSVPRAPRLEQLCFAASTDYWTSESHIAHSDQQQYLSLKWLLIVSPLGPRTAALYKRNSTNLKHLTILDAGDYPPQPLQCPNLFSVTLDDLAYLNYIVAPKLCQLAVCGDSLIVPLKDDWSLVTTLILYGDFEE